MNIRTPARYNASIPQRSHSITLSTVFPTFIEAIVTKGYFSVTESRESLLSLSSKKLIQVYFLKWFKTEMFIAKVP